MANRNKEFAKFLAGFATAQIIFHWGLGLFSVNLPLGFSFVTLTEKLNTFAMIFWPIVLVLMAYYGWGR